MSDFSNYLSPGRKGHLVGIGGVSMSSLAEVLQGMGITVTGSDMNESHNVSQLRQKGISVRLGHRAENIPADADFLVRTAAVHDDNPEIAFAREHDIPVFERTEAWGAISRDYRNALCISGTHGKTTTTSMCTHILMAADRDPTVMIGGTLPLLNAGHRVGRGDTIVMEPEERSAELSRECGIPLPILRKVEGREDAILLATDGSLVHGDIISAAARDRIRIKQARFIQHTSMTATLMLSGDVDEALGQEFIDQIKLRLGADMQVELQIVDDIPPLPSGKQRYALREFDLKEIRT